MKKEVTIELTNKCPLRCIHCSTKNSILYNGEKILSPKSLVKIVKAIILKDNNTDYKVRFSGGEPFLALEQIHISELEKCGNIRGFIVNSSGFLGIKTFNTNKPFTYRFSIYGNEEEHDDITLTAGSYEKTISSLECALNLGLNVELTTPIFDENNLMHVVKLARRYGNLHIRVAKEVLFGDFLIKGYAFKRLDDLIRAEKCKIAKECQNEYPEISITCSLRGECHGSNCDYEKLTVLATGKIIGCASEKSGINVSNHDL